MVPVCPRRENGHLWRFDRERSTTECQADVSQACRLAADVVSDGAGGALRGCGSKTSDRASSSNHVTRTARSDEEWCPHRTPRCRCNPFIWNTLQA